MVFGYKANVQQLDLLRKVTDNDLKSQTIVIMPIIVACHRV